MDSQVQEQEQPHVGGCSSCQKTNNNRPQRDGQTCPNTGHAPLCGHCSCLGGLAGAYARRQLTSTLFPRKTVATVLNSRNDLGRVVGNPSPILPISRSMVFM